MLLIIIKLFDFRSVLVHLYYSITFLLMCDSCGCGMWDRREVTGNVGMNRLTFKRGKKKLVSLLKVISPVVMVAAIALELWHLEARLTTSQFPSSLIPVLWFGHFAIAVHLIEAVIAAIYAPAKKHQPIQYGIYTFFVGTVGLWELFESDPTTSEFNSRS